MITPCGVLVWGRGVRVWSASYGVHPPSVRRVKSHTCRGAGTACYGRSRLGLWRGQGRANDGVAKRDEAVEDVEDGSARHDAVVVELAEELDLSDGALGPAREQCRGTRRPACRHFWR